MHKYSEQIIRHLAVNEDGKTCEILERITYERRAGVRDERVEINRRYDLRTGERLNRLSETEFEEDSSGSRLRLCPQ